MEQVKKITQNTLLPIGFVITIIMGSIWIGSLANQIQELRHKDSPSRTEFVEYTYQLKEIQKGVNDINTYLRAK
jgi:hypothetical protein